MNLSTNTFSSARFGWEMLIPEGWEIVHKESLDDQVERGLKMIDAPNSNELKQQLDAYYLLSFTKDKGKIFTAIAERFDTIAISFEQKNRNTKELLYNTLKEKGLEMDSVWGTEFIDEKKFRTFEIRVYDNSDKPFLYQKYYNRQIDNYIFAVILVYDSKEIEEILMENWRKSKFIK